MLMKKIIFTGPKGLFFRPISHGSRKNLIFRIMILTLLVGVAVGALSGTGSDKVFIERMDILFLTDFDVRCTQGPLASFAASFASAFIFMLVMFMSGLSLWGFIVCAAVPFLKGFGYGIAAGYIYGSYGIRGIIYNILIILPGAFICSAIMAAASAESIKNSLSMASGYFRTAVRDDPRLRMKEYCMSMLWLLFLSAISSGADMIFSLLFSWMFHFG